MTPKRKVVGDDIVRTLAGWDANQSMTGLPAVLNLATAAGMELSLASK